MPSYTRTRAGGLSCGAACLLVAARELGVTSFTIPAQQVSAAITTTARTLSSTQRQLCAVGFVGGLHWVLYRPDGTYMDPASGENFNYFVSMGQGPGYILKYVDTGISVVVDSVVV